jgi:hypothetical protein
MPKQSDNLLMKGEMTPTETKVYAQDKCVGETRGKEKRRLLKAKR